MRKIILLSMLFVGLTSFTIEEEKARSFDDYLIGDLVENVEGVVDNLKGSW